MFDRGLLPNNRVTVHKLVQRETYRKPNKKTWVDEVLVHVKHDLSVNRIYLSCESNPTFMNLDLELLFSLSILDMSGDG